MQWQQHLQCRPDSAVVIHNEYFRFAFCHESFQVVTDSHRLLYKISDII
jgi:hypothetical protein